MSLPYEFINKKTGKIVVKYYNPNDEIKCPRGYERVFSSDIKRGQNGTVKGR